MAKFEVIYWGACGQFYGRALSALLILEEAGAPYELKDQSGKPDGCFALPVVKTPGGATVSQTIAIAHTLGHELGMAPADAATDARCLQICCDATDFLVEACKPDAMMPERKAKWLNHFAAVLGADASRPLYYSDFQAFAGLELSIDALTAALEESDIPPDLKQWWDRMLATKAVARLKGAGIKLMPSSTGTGW